MADVALEGLSKHYDTQVAVRAVDLHVRDGELVTLLGPSGCGKTTTLRMIAGFIEPTGGVIRIGGRVVSDPAHRVLVPPERRRVGMVFQSYAVWPHMTVAENVAYPLRVRRVAPRDRAERVRQALAQVKLDDLGERYPHQLSGGQQQRVALARALVMEPDVLLLDEPLSNLDAKLREEMRIELKGLQQQLGITIVFVTHDQLEAMALSDRVVLMDRGEIVQIGPPEDLYERPTTTFAALFVGTANLLEARIDGTSAVVEALAGIRLTVPVGTPSGPAFVLVRPEHLTVSAQGEGPSARVLRSVYEGDTKLVILAAGDRELRARVPTTTPLAEGELVTVGIDRHHVVPA